MNIVSTDVENEVKNKNDEVIFFFFLKAAEKNESRSRKN
jgi:hypothetical protein